VAEARAAALKLSPTMGDLDGGLSAILAKRKAAKAGGMMNMLFGAEPETPEAVKDEAKEDIKEVKEVKEVKEDKDGKEVKEVNEVKEEAKEETMEDVKEDPRERIQEVNVTSIIKPRFIPSVYYFTIFYTIFSCAMFSMYYNSSVQMVV
jgi:hypothetical protein